MEAAQDGVAGSVPGSWRGQPGHRNQREYAPKPGDPHTSIRKTGHCGVENVLCNGFPGSDGWSSLHWPSEAHQGAAEGSKDIPPNPVVAVFNDRGLCHSDSTAQEAAEADPRHA
ncbi:hypothetical protein ES705_45434 [subsurface metagenome]